MVVGVKYIVFSYSFVMLCSVYKYNHKLVNFARANRRAGNLVEAL